MLVTNWYNEQSHFEVICLYQVLLLLNTNGVYRLEYCENKTKNFGANQVRSLA